MKKDSIRHIVAKVLRYEIPAADIEQLVRSEDGSAYDVWHIKNGERDYLLKKTKSHSEEDFYRTASGKTRSIVDYLGGTDYYGKRYMLTEYFTGHEMCRCTRQDLKLALDALISLQDLYWVQIQSKNEPASFGTSVQEELESILRRREHLQDPVLEKTAL